MKELEAKLAQAIKDRDTQTDCMNIEIALIEEQIAEEAKPKLRHGDYWPINGSYQIVLKRDSDLELFGDRSGCGMRPGISNLELRTGNIFDDLKALQEDVTEFEIEESKKHYSLKASLYTASDGGVQLVDSSGHEIGIDSAILSAFILKLRQMEATLKREQAKK